MNPHDNTTNEHHHMHAHDETAPPTHHSHHDHMAKDFKRRFFVSTALTVPILALSPPIQSFLGVGSLLAFPGASYVLFALAATIYAYGGSPFLRGMVGEMKRRRPGMMTLIATAISVSFVYSGAVVFGLKGKMFFWELATLIDIMLLGHWIEMRSVMGASRALEALVKLMPSTAHRLKKDGSLEEVEVSALQKGDLVVVKPGEKFPTDGVVTEGHSNVNESMLTGESKPVPKKPGDTVIGGAVNGEGALTMRVEKTGEETFLSQVVSMVKKAQEAKSKTQNTADRVAMYLTLTALTVGTITLLTWMLAGSEPAFAVERMVTVMVITCPHALGLAIPLVVAVSTSIAASRGLLIRNRTAFEEARSIDTVVFDKTGTLTEGDFGVKAVVPMSQMDENEILRTAASLESLSEHPLAEGIVAEAARRNLHISKPKDFTALPGKGVEGIVDGRKVAVVGPRYLEERGLQRDEAALKEHYDHGRTVVFLLVEDSPAGAIALGDTVKPDAAEAVATLKKMGIRTVMLTGDKKEAAAKVAASVGLDDFFAEVLPDSKAAKIRQLQEGGARTAMTGDGVNDAPALATADLGIAVGAGTEVAVETADVVLVRSNPSDVASIFLLARATYRKMIQNLLWATGYNVIAIPLAAGVLAHWNILLSPAAGAALMSVSTVIVAINARTLSVKT